MEIKSSDEWLLIFLQTLEAKSVYMSLSEEIHIDIFMTHFMTPWVWNECKIHTMHNYSDYYDDSLATCEIPE